jgi:hypothetical protein
MSPLAKRTRVAAAVKLPVTKRAALYIVACMLFTVAILAWVNVPTEPTRADITYIAKIMNGRDLRAPKSFEEQINTILAVQDAVLLASPNDEGIPLGTTREPKDLYLARTGSCFDRSRVIEKILTYLHVPNRHVAIYSTAHHSSLGALISTDVQSHAVTEALTSKGWMVIDPNARWVGLTTSNDPVSVDNLSSNYVWSRKNKVAINWILREPFVFIIGLYSRHGQFYPPYNPVPDFNIEQLVDNLI